MWLRQGVVRPATRSFRPQLRVRAFAPDAQAASPGAPTALELQRDSRLAAVSGLCYVPADELRQRLQAHGLELQADGNTHFTRWFVARPSAAATAAAEASAALGLGGTDGDPCPQQYVFLRGVSWRSADLDAFRVWQGLVRALPTPFLPHLTSPPELLMAHSGVAEMAEELYTVLLPHMEGASRLHVAGHSLGGSLATLLALTAHLKLGGGPPLSSSGSSSNASQRPRLQVQCTTFGSPPVLALSQGAEEDGRSILQALKLPLGAVRNYVLQDDPVPRALLSADPAFLALKSSPAVASLLRLRERWLGQGVLSPTRFLFHPAGDVYLIRWSAEAGHSVRLLAPHTLQEELRLDVETLRGSPLALMQAVLDHHHGSYSTELRAAAAALAKRKGAAPGTLGGIA